MSPSPSLSRLQLGTHQHGPGGCKGQTDAGTCFRPGPPRLGPFPGWLPARPGASGAESRTRGLGGRGRRAEPGDWVEGPREQKWARPVGKGGAGEEARCLRGEGLMGEGGAGEELMGEGGAGEKERGLQRACRVSFRGFRVSRLPGQAIDACAVLRPRHLTHCSSPQLYASGPPLLFHPKCAGVLSSPLPFPSSGYARAQARLRCPPVAMVTRSVPGAAWRAGAGQPRNARTGGLPGDQGSLCPAVVELCDLAGMEAPGARLGPPVSRDRVIADFPKWYTPEACLQLKDHFHGQVRAACRERRTGTVGLKVSKVVVLGDLYVGKTSLINRFCKDVFDRHYKATIGVDFEIERFEIAGVPYSLQIWDTAGQEKFKCIASAYYRGAQVIITAFDLADIKTLGHTRQWLADAQRENEPGSSSVFLVGTKKDLLSGPACERTEMDAVQLANEMQAEYWSVSAKTGENVKAFFTRVAALAFEQSVLQELERRGSRRAQIGAGASISIGMEEHSTAEDASASSPGCC